MTSVGKYLSSGQSWGGVNCKTMCGQGNSTESSAKGGCHCGPTLKRDVGGQVSLVRAIMACNPFRKNGRPVHLFTPFAPRRPLPVSFPPNVPSSLYLGSFLSGFVPYMVWVRSHRHCAEVLYSRANMRTLPATRKHVHVCSHYLNSCVSDDCESIIPARMCRMLGVSSGPGTPCE